MCEVGDVLSADPAALPDAALGELIVGLERVARRAQALQARAVRVFDARDAANGAGAASTACWLRDRLRLADRDARQAVGLARALDRLPVMSAALAAGQVTVAHARTLAGQTKSLDPAVVADGEPFLVDCARRLDPLRFATVVRRWVATVAPEAFERDTERRYDARWLAVAATYAGMVSVSGLLDPEGGAIVQAALDALVAANKPDDGRSREQQRADALVDLVELARAHELLPVPGGARPEILVHVPAAALAAGPAGHVAPGAARGGPGDGPGGSGGLATAVARLGPATLSTGAPLTGGAVERLVCDGRLRRLVLDALAVPVELGRATRVVPPALRKYVALRDGGCRYPGCPRGAGFCEAHHVIFWRHGGPTSADNLVLLCRYHHHLVHDRAHVLKLLPDGTVEATNPHGRVMTSRPRGPTEAPV